MGDNMVIQQNSKVRLWGQARPGAEVCIRVSWDADALYKLSSDKDGKFEIAIPSPGATYTPQIITFNDGDGEVTIKNVLVGEVWFAGGQSNMEMPLKGFAGCVVKDGMREAICAESFKGVRFFTVPKRHSWTIETDCESSWKTTESFEDVMNFSATAWFFARNLESALHVPVGIVVCAYGGTRVESWLPREILENYPDIELTEEGMKNMQDYERPLLPYNAMFHVACRYTYKGIIFYQGCSNVGRHENYAKRLATMVTHWRAVMGNGDIPFYYVEIAPYHYDGAQNEKSPYLREAQFKAQKMIPNSAMVSTNNLVLPFEKHNIHPQLKQPVGERLSYHALNKVYGYKDVCCDGPQYSGAWKEKNGEAWVSFENLQMGICRNYDIQGFEVAGEDRIFHPADTIWLHWQTNEVVVSSKRVKQPVAVRYCFKDFMPGTLIGGNELPCIPFRTDEW